MTGQLNLPLRLSDSASFDNFYPIGNEAVVEVVRSVTNRTNDKPSLFIHGPPGSGKSHLLQALSRLTVEAHGLNVYVPAGASGVSPDLVSQLNADTVVCLDDLELIVGDREWEEGILELYERLNGGDGVLIVSAKQPPSLVGLALADLATRFAAGGVYSLKPLAELDLPQALRFRAGMRGLDLPDSVIQYLIRRLPRNSSVLFSLLDRIDKAAFSRQRRITVPFVKEHEKEFLSEY